MNLFKSTDNHRNVNRNKMSAVDFFHILAGKDLFFLANENIQIGITRRRWGLFSYSMAERWMVREAFCARSSPE